MRRIGLELIEERSRAVIEEHEQVLAGKGGEIDGDKTILGRDILSVLSKSRIYTAVVVIYTGPSKVKRCLGGQSEHVARRSPLPDLDLYHGWA
jgi:hypothetical protein